MRAAALVRINAPGTAWFDADLDAIAALDGLDGIVLPKAQSAAELERVRRVLPGIPIIALIETARGLHAVDDVAATASRLAFGSVDYAVDLGIAHIPEALGHARSSLVLASRVAGLPAPIDGATLELRNAERIEADARYAASLGFSGKLLIHPEQVAPARRGLAPTDAEVRWARTVVERSQSQSAVAIDGAMIDVPVVKQAERVLGRHNSLMGAL